METLTRRVVGLAVAVATALLVAPSTAWAGSCSSVTTAGSSTVFDFRFCDDSEEWTGGFADLPPSGLEDPAYQLSFGRASLPTSTGVVGDGLRLAGTNASDDLLMFIKRQVTGLRPSTRYAAKFHVRFATNAGRGCARDGWVSGGDSVTAKAGAASVEPQARVKDGMLRLNLDVGNQARAGADAVVLGSAGADGIGCSGRSHVFRTLASRDAGLLPRSDRDGNLWLFFGFDSGFEGRSDIHVERIRVELTPVER
jgi:hypothetical protein